MRPIETMSSLDIFVGLQGITKKLIPFLLFVLVFSETIRKLELRLQWVPVFVLNSEPLFSMSSYGVVVCAIMWWISWALLGSIFIAWLEKRHPDTLKNNEIHSVLTKEFWIQLFMIYIFYVSFSQLTNSPDLKDGELLYISDVFRVEKNSNYYAVYKFDSLEPLAFCKGGFTKDECYKEKKE